MERLTSRDLRRALDFVRGIYAIRDFDGFVSYLLSSLPALVRSDFTSYNELWPAESRSNDWLSSSDVCTPARRQAWIRLMPEHPSLACYERTGGSRALRLSDFLTQREFHRTAVYNELFRDLNIEDILTLSLPPEHSTVRGIALHRGRQFSERDLLTIESVRPYLVDALGNALVFSRVVRDSAVVDRALGGAGRGLLTLNSNCEIRFATAMARKWLNYYFNAAPAHDRLPEELRLWVRYHDANLCQTLDLPPPRKPLVVTREGRRLSIRLISEPQETTLLLEEQGVLPDSSSFGSLGLSGRQSQVLAALSGGGSNFEIARTLEMSPRTVQTHLRFIYKRLGVRGRAAAVAEAMRAAPSQSPVYESLALVSRRV